MQSFTLYKDVWQSNDLQESKGFLHKVLYNNREIQNLVLPKVKGMKK